MRSRVARTGYGFPILFWYKAQKPSGATQLTQRHLDTPELASRPRIAPVVSTGGRDAPMAPKAR